MHQRQKINRIRCYFKLFEYRFIFKHDCVVRLHTSSKNSEDLISENSSKQIATSYTEPLWLGECYDFIRILNGNCRTALKLSSKIKN